VRARSRPRARMFLAALRSLSRVSPHVGHTWALSDGCSVHNKPLLGPSITPNPFTLGDGGPTEYRIRLTLKGKTIDEAEVKVSYGFG
jgi:hypothetical protein